MSLEIKNSKNLINDFKLTLLVIGLPGSGKTLMACSAPNPGVAACESGHGKGMLTVVKAGVDYACPSNYDELLAIVNGKIFADKESLVFDSLSDMGTSIIRDFALTIPRAKGETKKRAMGVPELDDYNTMGVVTGRLLRKIMEIDKHIIVTAKLKIQTPDAETGKGAYLMGPDLPGAMFLASPGFFDHVFYLKTRSYLRDSKDPKSKVTERYILTQGDDIHIGKSRASIDGKAILPAEIPFNIETKEGFIPDVLAKLKAGYAS